MVDDRRSIIMGNHYIYFLGIIYKSSMGNHPSTLEISQWHGLIHTAPQDLCANLHGGGCSDDCHHQTCFEDWWHGASQMMIRNNDSSNSRIGRGERRIKRVQLDCLDFDERHDFWIRNYDLSTKPGFIHFDKLSYVWIDGFEAENSTDVLKRPWSGRYSPRVAELQWPPQILGHRGAEWDLALLLWWVTTRSLDGL